ncbi:hypothetical protein [Levilactobacillus brevis]|uniref:hypothetical protein n=1 Tax=Levilactobacillus brevis TaxID=1580 RepID=UPI000A20B088|nr:hypothetical protein [Levilactobacillus brevis]ARN89786.1 hypothetical protein AZI09_04320 [Levilactobacillus brevis]ARN97370.1 hypothetical protein AZI10_04300 [Levilactobacillus brevis]ARN97433.1 hypothetical protein AZI10_04655 [Levilactobacillus brevis]
MEKAEFEERFNKIVKTALDDQNTEKFVSKIGDSVTEIINNNSDSNLIASKIATKVSSSFQVSTLRAVHNLLEEFLVDDTSAK